MVDASVVVNWRILLVTSGSEQETKRNCTLEEGGMARTNNVLGELVRMGEKGTTTATALLK